MSDRRDDPGTGPSSAPRRDWHRPSLDPLALPPGHDALDPEEAAAASPSTRPAAAPPAPSHSRDPIVPASTAKPPKAPRKRRSWPRRIAMWIVKAILAFILLSLVMVTIFCFVPPPITWTMIGDVFAGHGVRKSWMPLSQISPNMARAAIAAEDARFCEHHGFDYRAIAAAAARNATGKKLIRGGSTISQQTAKNVFLWQGGGYVRKGLEAWFTLLIENIWGKRRIMDVYLNVADTGIGTYGVNAGSLRYFKHDASTLNPREAAQIAAVLPLPKKRAGIDPRGYTRRYGNSINARIGVVRNDGLDACLR